MGLERIHQIAVSCSFLKLLPSLKDVSPSVFWAHSLGCALVAREFAGKIGFPDPGKAYAAGLLHDVGIIALLSAAPEQFATALRLARSEHMPLHDTFLIAVALAGIALIASLFMPVVPLRARQPRRQQPAFGEIPASPEAAERDAAVG